MVDDPIVAEVRAARGRLAARFDYDLEAIFRHIQAEEARSGLMYVPCPPRETALADGAREAEPRADGHDVMDPESISRVRFERLGPECGSPR